MGEDAESDFAIPFVDENDYSEISAKAVSAKPKLKKNRLSLLYRANSRARKSLTGLNTLNILSGSFIIYSLKRAISGLMFIFFVFIAIIPTHLLCQL